MIKTLMKWALPVLMVIAPAALPIASASASSPVAMACRYAAYAPAKEGTLVRGWGEKWECGSGTNWTITVQRHRGGWWQNEGRNFHTGDGWVSVTGACASGQWTYRTILESNVGHKTVSSNAVITC